MHQLNLTNSLEFYNENKFSNIFSHVYAKTCVYFKTTDSIKKFISLTFWETIKWSFTDKQTAKIMLSDAESSINSPWSSIGLRQSFPDPGIFFAQEKIQISTEVNDTFNIVSTVVLWFKDAQCNRSWKIDIKYVIGYFVAH